MFSKPAFGCEYDMFCWFSVLFSPKIGLAVDDIKGVQEQAVLERQAMLVRIKPVAF